MKSVNNGYLVERSRKLGEYIITRLIELKESFPEMGDVRGKGLMIDEIVDPDLSSLILHLS